MSRTKYIIYILPVLLIGVISYFVYNSYFVSEEAVTTATNAAQKISEKIISSDKFKKLKPAEYLPRQVTGTGKSDPFFPQVFE